MARFLFLGVQMMWTGVLLLFCLDLWVSADELGRPTTFWWDNDIQVKKHSDQQSWGHIFRKYCDSAHIKDCDRGYYRERSGPHKGRCVPCNCNGLSNDCDPHTGKCLNCQFNTAGDHCERCMEGYYGSAVMRTCCMCPCPLADPSNSFAVGCLRVGDEFECLCKPGYAGVRCERCALGYYGNPLVKRGSCQPCDCDHGYVCDPLTGDCFEADDPDTGNCLECDTCVIKLMDDLDAMDDEFSKLKTQLEFYSRNATSHTGLEKLEDAIAGTKVLVHKYSKSVFALKPKVLELESDLESIIDDLTVLNDKAIEMFCTAGQLLKTLDQTYQRGDNLRSESVKLLRKIQEFLEELKRSNHTGGNTEEATRMIKEAQWMLVKMRRQSCRVQRELANEELRKARTLLNLILNDLMVPLNGSLVVTDHIRQKLMDQAEDLKDIQEALIDAQLDVIKANAVNKLNEELLRNILKQLKVLRKNQGNIMANVNMTRETLKETSDFQKMMADLTKEMTHLAALIDGAKNELEAKLELLANATAKAGIVRQAEEHAQELMKLAMDFQMFIRSITNSTAVQKAIEAIKAFTDVIDAIKEAEAAAKHAKEVADQAFEDVQGQDLQNKANDLKNFANTLLVKAKEAEIQLEDVTQKCEAYKNLIQQAKDKQNTLKQVLQDVLERMNNIKRDDIRVLINQAKEGAADVNATAGDAITRIQNISEELAKIKISSQDSNLNNLLDGVNKTLTELDQSFPSLIDKLNEVENQSEHMPSPANISNSIQKIKDLIEQTRDAANRIRGPILFSGDAHIELRPPKDLEDFRTFTALNLTLHQPKARGDGRRRRQLGVEDNQFVFYLGNKHTVRGFIGLVVKNGVLFCVYKVGGRFYEIKTSEITKSNNDKAFMDRVDFRRVYQDAQVMYTETFTSTEPKVLPPMINKPSDMNGLLDLDPNEVVLYVGGYPEDFEPPEELRYPGYKGCIEFSTLNDRILGLYNFQRAINITKTDMCQRGKVHMLGDYFDGTGYGKVAVSRGNSLIKFFVRSHQMDAVLFYVGSETSHFLVTFEGGYIVLKGKNNYTNIFEKSKLKVFPLTNLIHIRMILNEDRPATITVTDNINIFFGNVKGFFEEAYIGGVPAAVREKYNIVLPPLRGCVNNVHVDVTASFTEEVGIVRGCPNPLLGSREATFKFGSSLSLSPPVNDTDSGTMVSLGFKISQENVSSLILTGGMNNEFLLSLNDGYVEMSDNKKKLTSTNQCETGKWHYITAYRSGAGMQLNVDNTDIGNPPPPSSSTTFTELGENVILGDGLFEGCLRNLYIRSLQTEYIPADLSRFNQTGNVSLGFCKAERPPLDSTKKRARHAGITFNSDSGRSKQGCRNPKSVKNTYHLGSNSQMQFKIDPEKLNNRLHFSLDVRTKSSEGLLLHVSGKYGVPLVILYLDKGKVKLSVGADELISSQKINDGDWHNIKSSMKQHNFHLVVDGVQTPDGHSLKGFTHDLQSPVYVGHGKFQMLHKTQEKVPQKSIIGCIQDIRVSKVLLVDPAVSRGVTPCFKGVTEKGAYFAGNGAHLVLEKHLIFGSTYNLAFEFRPRNLTGLVFHKIDNRGRTLTLFLKKGKVVLTAYNGQRRYGTALTPTRPLCDAFHYVTVSIRRKTIELRVDEVSSRVRQKSVYLPPSHETIYIGGISENRSEEVEMQASYVGCLRNVRLNQNPITFDGITSIFGPINSKCPAE
ncbi:laminin subunit alpha-3 [Sinocyclocheilus anshuiensis]|uniref:laminin subunit alpha-3 n=1 Tax=Sinocyclocheilus anshuiensis TaxID=1608454 RepID=UPI0007BA8DA4|nr:PREDICTED: laminin subunit alpha-3-like [Sinocyclocheilus anshuiensis]